MDAGTSIQLLKCPALLVLENRIGPTVGKYKWNHVYFGKNYTLRKNSSEAEMWYLRSKNL